MRKGFFSKHIGLIHLAGLRVLQHFLAIFPFIFCLLVHLVSSFLFVSRSSACIAMTDGSCNPFCDVSLSSPDGGRIEKICEEMHSPGKTRQSSSPTALIRKPLVRWSDNVLELLTLGGLDNLPGAQQSSTDCGVVITALQLTYQQNCFQCIEQSSEIRHPADLILEWHDHVKHCLRVCGSCRSCQSVRSCLEVHVEILPQSSS